ncbi:vacuolar assembling protein VPS41 [Rhodotorula toruloides]|uniref:Vacuolar assembling protein VPS41 n=1 Tax=Rhodotorula toruloides TaxID=5286 RepID=A0A2T0A5I4_RHOTO|nr:vacuolar assembling protein VPS41 [Rhodotorula toruloides]
MPASSRASSVRSLGTSPLSPPRPASSVLSAVSPPSTSALPAMLDVPNGNSSAKGKGKQRAVDVVPSTEGLLHSVTSGGSTDARRKREGDRGTGDESESESEEGEEEEEEEELEEDGSTPSPEETEEERPPPSPRLEKRIRDGVGEDEEKGKEQAEEQEEDEEGEAGSSAEEDGEGDEDDDEPTLKYARLGGSTTNILSKDTASAIAVCSKYTILGTHNGALFVLSPEGMLIKRFHPHSAMINDLSIDSTCEFVASASMDGRVAIQSLTTSEAHVFDMQRPMRCVALEPFFGKRNTRQCVSGGMAGNLILSEKGWLGQKDVTLYSGEGPIWAVEWRGTFIAWASDAGVRIYDTATSQRITYISRAEDSPRADLFKCNLRWRDDRTLLIAWADVIKVAVVKERESKRVVPGLPSATELYVEVSAIFQVDCMISGIAPYGKNGDLLVLAYTTEEDEDNEADDSSAQRRKAGSRPELRIISPDGEELSSDAISLRNYDRFQCRDYSLCPSANGQSFLVVSPEDIVVAQTRDESDHIVWLIEMQRYEEALHALEKSGLGTVGGFDVTDVGKKYLEYLVEEGEYDKTAASCPKILGINAKLWEDWVFLFAEKGHLETIIPYVPTHDPQLSRLVYEMILAHYLRHDEQALLRTIHAWPHEIYDVSAVILAVKNQLDRTRASDSHVLMQALTELYILNRQPGKALPYFLKLRDPHVFTLIRDNNLFTDIQDQALQLIEFDEDLRKNDKALESESRHGTAIELLVDHTHSIPIPRVISQLQESRKYLYMYLDALFDKDPHLAFDYSDLQVDLYAEYDQKKLMDFLRASNYYSLERAYKICDNRDLVPEMVFLLGRMGDNKRALNLIIERLGDVERAIEFAKEQNDNDLWEDLLKYSENKPRFIRGLLENVGAEIDPIRLIRRIKNGLEIPGLKPALIKILQDFQLQISLMDGCRTVLYSDCRDLALSLHRSQTSGFLWTGDTPDQATGEPIFPHLSGAPVPASLPFGVRFLSGPAYLGTSAFPSLASADTTLSSLSPIQPVTKRDQLVAASLLASLSTPDYEEEDFDVRPVEDAERAMEDKVATVKELKEKLVQERRRSARAAVRVDV